MNASGTVRLLMAYAHARRHDRLRDRQRLESIQQRWLTRLQQFLVLRSPFYSRYAGVSWVDWPVLSKAPWMENFDTINTVGAHLADVSAIAHVAERTRDFSKRWGPFTIGLSTGTSGSRGLFLASPAECVTWAGTLLGKLLRGGLLARERIALVLRAGATLYDTVGSLRLRFRFFDQSQPWGALVRDLAVFGPTLLVAPPSALRLLADSTSQLRPRRVISVAEVLEPLDRIRIERRFEVPVEQIYQATEGLLGVSCEAGTVHLNEPYILVEPEWQDRERTRFVPIVTDLWRRTQPVVRYRLNDVLQVARKPCPCGRASLALAAIEGRTDDILWLAQAGSPAAQTQSEERVPVFPDVLARAVVSALPDVEDYQVEELSLGAWRVGLSPMPTPAARESLHNACAAIATRSGAIPPTLDVRELLRNPGTGKRRRIQGARSRACVS